MAILRKATWKKAAIQGARDNPQGASSLAVLTAAAGRTHKCISSVHMYGTMGERLCLFTAQHETNITKKSCKARAPAESQNWPNPLNARTPTHLQQGRWVSLSTASFCNIMMFWKRSGFRGWVGLLKPFSPECCYDPCMVQGEKRASPLILIFCLQPTTKLDSILNSFLAGLYHSRLNASTPIAGSGPKIIK